VEIQHVRDAGSRQICSSELSLKSACWAQELMMEIFDIAERYAYHSNPELASRYT